MWTLFSDLILYSAERIPEISDRIVEVDRAMRWGYAHKLGPFELWDALGFEEVCDRIEKSGRALPAHIVSLRRAGVKSLYRASEYLDLKSHEYRPLERTGLLLSRCTRFNPTPVHRWSTWAMEFCAWNSTAR